MIADELRRQADVFAHLVELRAMLSRDKLERTKSTKNVNSRVPPTQ